MKAQGGFTLVEVILAILLLGTVSGLLAMFLSRGVQGFVDSREASQTALKAQAALTRISLELKDATAISAYAADTSITYTNTELSSSARTLSYSAGTLSLDGNTLLDGIQSFSLTRNKAADLDNDGDTDVTGIAVGFTLSGYPAFQTTVYPRGAID